MPGWLTGEPVMKSSTSSMRRGVPPDFPRYRQPGKNSLYNGVWHILLVSHAIWVEECLGYVQKDGECYL
ncbi:hypothetical protein LIER_31005 [Lithospermum erythrorhizon]|uniref:Uncharacterized protein n=1 Tax=Lithospermum erythrorhizon TaxID=34254 RepID=A0AAV3RTA9_LITER